MVGSLKRVGEGAWQPAEVRRALEARNRTACGPVAPPTGLYLMAVDYPVSLSPSLRGEGQGEGQPPPQSPTEQLTTR